MISKYQVPDRLLNELPGIAIEFNKIYPSTSIVKAIECLVNFTRLTVEENNVAIIKKCFDVAEDLYMNGDTEVKQAIELVYKKSYLVPDYQCKRNENYHGQLAIPLFLRSAYLHEGLKTTCYQLN